MIFKRSDLLRKEIINPNLQVLRVNIRVMLSTGFKVKHSNKLHDNNSKLRTMQMLNCYSNCSRHTIRSRKLLWITVLYLVLLILQISQLLKRRAASWISSSRTKLKSLIRMVSRWVFLQYSLYYRGSLSNGIYKYYSNNSRLYYFADQESSAK